MSRQKTYILNNFFKNCPEKVVLTSVWLKNHGIDHKLVWKYVSSGWLQQLSPKAYCKPGTNITWASAVSAMQEQLKLHVYVGEKTALQLLGKAHYLPLAGISQIELFKLAHTPIPRWLLKSELWDAKFEVITASLFETKVYSSIGLTAHEQNGVTLKISAPERAIMEVFHQVTNDASYEEALLLMENLTNLRPQVVQTLLENCKSFKVKRLFLYTAEKFHHEWLNDLNLKKIDLGHGKRKIGSGGDYQAKYQLSVPRLKENL